MSQQVVTIPLNQLLRTPRRRRRQRRTRRQNRQLNPASQSKIQQLTASVQKLEGVVTKALQPKAEAKQKFFLVKQSYEKSPDFIIPPSDKKDTRRKMGKESIDMLGNEVKRAIVGGGGEVIYNEGALHCHFEILAPGSNHADIDDMLSSLNLGHSSKGSTSQA
uniref:Uncharacterized protein n=1 Tax=Guangdong mandarin rat snake torovirus TaxID=2116382 RepID=A0A2P1GNP9_9NIDO|nr:hypothetical protein [Guangdong mandarin rat snake torovirus]